jgi:hypothetical protein
VRRARVPIVALSSPDEHFVDAAERRRLKDAVEESGGRWCERPGGHLVLTCDTRILFAEEIELLRSVHAPPAEARARTILAALPADVAAQFADGSPDRARLEALCAFSDCREPLRTAAVAQRSADADEGWRLLRILPRIAHGKSFEGLCALCDLDDPAGRMSIDTLERGCRVLDTFERFGVMRLVPTPEQLAAVASGETCRCSATISFTSTIQLEMSFDAKDIRDAVNELPLSRADAQRQTGRLLLKMFGYADRVRTGDAITVEALHGGVWRAFEPLPDGEDWAIHVEFGFLPGDPPDPNGGMLIRARQP